MNTNINRNRVDNLVSPQAAVILKPTENLSIYYAYSVSYLPASGDQFSALTDGTRDPRAAEIREQRGRHQMEHHCRTCCSRRRATSSTATTCRSPTRTMPGFFILSGANRIRGFETELKGYVTDNWQSSLGYAYTDARITSATSATIVPGNRIQLVPFNQFSWWNKYQFTPIWAASVGVIYFSDSFASSDDTV